MRDKESGEEEERKDLRRNHEQGPVRKPNRVKQDPGNGGADEGSEGKDRRPEPGDESVRVDGVWKSVTDGRLVSIGESSNDLRSQADAWNI